ncbi:MAG: hypothetical protein KGL35_05375, partial [Bradyrhizobium sp.]|nr:hypothetical protein [Bradyrhizobium sp.]
MDKLDIGSVCHACSSANLILRNNDRVGDYTFGDDANDVAYPRAETAVENNRCTGAMALQPCKHQAQKILVSANDEPPFGEAFDENVRVDLRSDPKARTWRDEAHDPSLPL